MSSMGSLTSDYVNCFFLNVDIHTLILFLAGYTGAKYRHNILVYTTIRFGDRLLQIGNVFQKIESLTKPCKNSTFPTLKNGYALM